MTPQERMIKLRAINTLRDKLNFIYTQNLKRINWASKMDYELGNVLNLVREDATQLESFELDYYQKKYEEELKKELQQESNHFPLVLYVIAHEYMELLEDILQVHPELELTREFERSNWGDTKKNELGQYYYHSPLSLALKKGNTAIVERLIRAYVPVEISTHANYIEKDNPELLNLLHHAKFLQTELWCSHLIQVRNSESEIRQVLARVEHLMKVTGYSRNQIQRRVLQICVLEEDKLKAIEILDVALDLDDNLKPANSFSNFMKEIRQQVEDYQSAIRDALIMEKDRSTEPVKNPLTPSYTCVYRDRYNPLVGPRKIQADEYVEKPEAGIYELKVL